MTGELVVRKMSEVKIRAIDWIWPGWIARGKFHLLAGYAGDGKSMMTSSLVAALSRGEMLPNGVICKPQRIALLLAEDDLEDTAKPRLLWHGADMTRIHAIEAVEEEGRRRAFSIEKHLDLLEPLIVDRGIDVLIVDPVSSFMQGSDRNAENVRDVLQPLKELAGRTRVAVLGIAHVGKSSAATRRPLERVLGATAFVAFSRLVWMLAPASQEPDEAERVLAVMKSNVGLKPPPLGWRFGGQDEPIQWTGQVSGANFTAAFNGGSTSDLTPERRKILDCLKDTGQAKPSTIALDTGLDPKVTSKLLRKMLDDGHVVEVGYGTYGLPQQKEVGELGEVGEVSANGPLRQLKGSSGTGRSGSPTSPTSTTSFYRECSECGRSAETLSSNGRCPSCELHAIRQREAAS